MQMWWWKKAARFTYKFAAEVFSLALPALVVTLICICCRWSITIFLVIGRANIFLALCTVMLLFALIVIVVVAVI